MLCGHPDGQLCGGSFPMSDKLIALFAEGLEVDASNLTDETSPENTEQWDSLAAMSLVMLIEDSFRVKLSTRDIMKMRTIGIAREVLRSKGIEGI
jgi:acyl carrier protein